MSMHDDANRWRTRLECVTMIFIEMDLVCIESKLPWQTHR
jgi:hypothetical protein